MIGDISGGLLMVRLRAQVRRALSSARSIARRPLLPERRVQGTWLQGIDAALFDLAVARLRRFPVYRDADYCTLNRDVAESTFDPAVHAIGFGAFEARRFFLPAQARKSLNRVVPVPAPSAVGRKQDDVFVSIYVNSRGNAFMRDIASNLALDLSESGIATRLGDETSSPTDHDGIRLFVAPHEFFTLGVGPNWMRDDVIRDAFMFGTEQLLTPWFARSLPFLLMARGAVDMSSGTAGLLRQAGLPATDYLPSVHRAKVALTQADISHKIFQDLPIAAQKLDRSNLAFAERPIDIAFLGTNGPRRLDFFARGAAVINAFRSVIVLRDADAGPITLESDGASLTRLAAHVAAHAKIMLNIHQNRLGYFEWHRIVCLGMANGSLVVSEPCEPHRVFQAGVHYLEVEAVRIPALLDWLLRSPEGRVEAERVRGNATISISDKTATRRDVMRLFGFLNNPAIPKRNGWMKGVGPEMRLQTQGFGSV